MPKKYNPVPNYKRELLCRSIEYEGMNVTQAAAAAGVYYPTAKVIAKIWRKEGRTAKKLFRNTTNK